MTDIASLAFSIDTSDVRKAEDELDGLTQAGAKSEAAAKGVESAWSGVGQKVGAAAAPVKSTAGAFKQGSDAIKGQQDALSQLLGRIDPVVKKLGDLDNMERELRDFKIGGALDADTFKEFQGRIEASRKSLGEVGETIRKTGLSSAQTAQALQQLPMQFSDIFVSLQAGQSPLQVFLQQGAQIKDSFGGIGPAIRETGKFALGLVSPMTIATAAVVALGVAYKQGSDEATAFAKSITLTGNAAGTSVDQLATAARSVSQSVGTVGAAAEVLAQLAGTGTIAVSSFDSIATAALKMEKAVGKSTAETVEEFAKLAKDPVNASRELNNELNYLTATQYQQIAALQEQGDELGAAALAERAYADALSQRADEIVENLGSIETAWYAVKGAAKGAWDAILDIGREDTLQQKLQGAFNVLNNATSSRGVPGRAQGLGIDTRNDAEQAEKDIIATWAKMAEDGEKALDSFQNAIRNKAAIEGLDLLRREYDETSTTVERLQKRLENLNKAADANITAGSWTDAEQAKFEKAADSLQRQIDEAQKPKKTGRTAAPKAVTDDAATRMLQQLREQGAALEAQLSTTSKLTSAQQEQIKFQQLIADLKGKAVLTADQKSLLANESMISAQLEQNVALDQQIQKRQELTRLAADEAREQERINQQAQSVADSLQTDEERILSSYERRREIILKNTEITGQAQTELLRRLEEKRNEDLLTVSDDYWTRWLAAAEKSLSSFDELAGSVVENFSTQFGSAFESMVFDAETLEGAVGGMAESMARAVVNALGQMAAQWLAYQAVQLLVGKSTQASAATSMSANASAMAVQSGINAFASTAAIPIVGPALAPAAMAAALATTTPMAIAVGNLALAGMAHDGIDSVPREGTWLLDKGERVVDSRTNQDLKQFLSGAGGVTANQTFNMSFPGITDSREAKRSTAQAAKQFAQASRDSLRYA